MPVTTDDIKPACISVHSFVGAHFYLTEHIDLCKKSIANTATGNWQWLLFHWVLLGDYWAWMQDS